MFTVAVVLFVSLVGAVLGMRYVVLSLVPVFLAIVAGLALVAAANDFSAGWTIAYGLVLGIVLQAGYLAGVAVNHVLLLGRAQAMAWPRANRAEPAGDVTGAVVATGERGHAA